MKIILATVLSVLIFIPSLAQAEEEVTLPTINCTVKYAHGSFFGYIPPKEGLTIKWDLNKMEEQYGKESSLIQFQDPNSDPADDVALPYIPLQSPLKNTQLDTYENGSFKGAIFESKSDGTSVRIDIQPKGMNKFWAYIMQESRGYINSFAYLQCE